MARPPIRIISGAKKPEMPGELDIKIRGAKELQAALRDLDQKVSSRLAGAAVRAGARVVAADAKRRVPIRTGALKRSIVVRGERKRRGTERKAFVVARTPYAHIVELGSVRMEAKPFLRPALDTQGQAAVDKMTENLGAGIERELAKYKGK